jgi:hypothetical protein
MPKERSRPGLIATVDGLSSLPAAFFSGQKKSPFASGASGDSQEVITICRYRIGNPRPGVFRTKTAFFLHLYIYNFGGRSLRLSKYMNA